MRLLWHILLNQKVMQSRQFYSALRDSRRCRLGSRQKTGEQITWKTRSNGNEWTTGRRTRQERARARRSSPHRTSTPRALARTPMSSFRCTSAFHPSSGSRKLVCFLKTSDVEFHEEELDAHLASFQELCLAPYIWWAITKVRVHSICQLLHTDGMRMRHRSV